MIEPKGLENASFKLILKIVRSKRCQNPQSYIFVIITISLVTEQIEGSYITSLSAAVVTRSD